MTTTVKLVGNRETLFVDLSEHEYSEMINDGASRLCGYSCGAAVDIILEYVSRPDCSKAQLDRLITSLTNKYRE